MIYIIHDEFNHSNTQSNVSVKIKNRDGKTAADIAKQHGHDHIVSRLAQSRSGVSSSSARNSRLLQHDRQSSEIPTVILSQSQPQLQGIVPPSARTLSSLAGSGGGIGSSIDSSDGTRAERQHPSIPTLISPATVLPTIPNSGATAVFTNTSGLDAVPILSANARLMQNPTQYAIQLPGNGTGTVPSLPGALSSSGSGGTQTLETMEKMTADLAVHLGKVNRIAANISVAKSAGAAAASSSTSASSSTGDSFSVALSPRRNNAVSNVSAGSGKEQSSYSLMGQGTGGGLDETSLALRKFLENEQKERRSAEAKVGINVDFSILYSVKQYWSCLWV